MGRVWKVVLVGVVVSLASPAWASITGVTAVADTDGALFCYAPTWSPTQEGALLNLSGCQYSGPGQILGTVVTDNDLDPTIHFTNAIDNDTAYSWTSYQVNVYMNKTFTLSDVAVTVPGSWSVSGVVQPLLTSSTIYDGDGNVWAFAGTMSFVGGTPIAPTGAITFDYKATFAGGALFSQEMTPIPEPVTMGMLAMGGLAMLRNRRTR
ncbi:MAG: PEP-CTERM sorting domain-containing protein [Planctomycetota bacterium]|nr:PEP-CTERM sorting domain-containing protein [Planctomycetota bacterium]